MRTIQTKPVVMPTGVETTRFGGAPFYLDIAVSRIISLDADSINTWANSTLLVAPQAGPVKERFELSDPVATIIPQLNRGGGNVDESFTPEIIGYDTTKANKNLTLMLARIIMIVPGPATDPQVATFNATRPVPNGNAVIVYDNGGLMPSMIHTSSTVDELYKLIREDSYRHPLPNPFTIAVSGISSLNPLTVTLASPYVGSVGDFVYFDSVGGMTELNSGVFVVSSFSGLNIQLEDLDGVAIDATSFGGYTGGGNLNTSHLTDQTFTEPIRKVSLKEMRGLFAFGDPPAGMEILINPGRIIREEESSQHPGDQEITYEREGTVLIVD